MSKMSEVHLIEQEQSYLRPNLVTRLDDKKIKSNSILFNVRKNKNTIVVFSQLYPKPRGTHALHS